MDKSHGFVPTPNISDTFALVKVTVPFAVFCLNVPVGVEPKNILWLEELSPSTERSPLKTTSPNSYILLSSEDPKVAAPVIEKSWKMVEVPLPI